MVDATRQETAPTFSETGARTLTADARYVALTPPPAGVPPGPRRGTPATLACAAGLLLASSAGGAWVRQTVVTVDGAQPEVLAEQLGWGRGGVVLLVLGAILAVTAPAWSSGARRTRRRLAALAGIAAVVGGTMLVGVQGSIRTLVAAAIADADVASHHVGSGWGTWAAATGVALAAVAVVVELLSPPDDPTATTVEPQEAA